MYMAIHARTAVQCLHIQIIVTITNVILVSESVITLYACALKYTPACVPYIYAPLCDICIHLKATHHDTCRSRNSAGIR